MKLAKLNDLRRALEARTKSDAPSVDLVSFKDLPGFENAAVPLDATFFAICGGTGVGKSALLELLFQLLAWEDSRDPSMRLGSCEARVNVTLRDQSYTSSLAVGTLTLTSTGPTPNCSFIGLADRTSTAQDFFRSSDIETLKEGVAGRAMPDKLKDTIGYICRNSYNVITFYEVEFQPDRILPFFEVERDGVHYDSRTMATGELSVFYLAWALAFSEPWSIILIEEPEAFLPPLSHQAVFGLICQSSVENHHAFVISTHSAEIASQFSEPNLISVRVQGGKSLVPTTRESKLRVLSRLGLLPAKTGVLFVEDRLAQIILAELLHHYEFAISANLEIAERDGDGGVHAALKGLPSDLSSLTFLGVLDGDVRTKAEKWKVAESLVFLPFASAMEREFFAVLLARTSAFAKEIGRNQETVEDVLAAHNGADFHDRFNFLAEDLGVSYDTLARTCFRLWLKTPGKKAAARKFANELSKKLGVTLPE